MIKNNKKKPIGVFDSGLGGLTVVSRLSELLPGEDILYLGDTGRVPYGGRSRETIIKYTREDIAFLLSKDIKAVVVACGTASTTALDLIADDYTVPVYGVLQPTVKRAVETTKSGKIGIIGTQASIGSGAYVRGIKAYMPDAELISTACPLFVPLVENGRVTPGDVVIDTVTAEYLEPIKAAGVDTLILGCTHYPLLEGVIQEYMSPAVTLISSGTAAADFVAGELERLDMLSGCASGGSHSYFVTDSVDNFSPLASMFLRRDVEGDVMQVELGG